MGSSLEKVSLLREDSPLEKGRVVEGRVVEGRLAEGRLVEGFQLQCPGGSRLLEGDSRGGVETGGGIQGKGVELAV